uniref:Protein arginine N-methyltransferase domain-containing protein n=1 Tax=Skeletonema marinoi TaxID=267567 RepID=A0A7S2M309_9STRA|mmetsp:Transcript_3856/g.6574  ORF Transcript_3856/g.6574 Transcript_3856/m.6574 type:complete len:471 (+) Transcript_3856:82-1494(+)
MKMIKSFLTSCCCCCLVIQILLAAQSAAAAESKSFTSTTTTTTNIDHDDDTIPTFHTQDEQQKASDYANYFSSYADLYHQKIMLKDQHRMNAYYNAIMKNQHVFRDKVVMDVGSGSGILAVWAAKAGAKRVYAVEYTDMAKHARNVVKANGVDHIVTVIQGAVEDVKIPIEDWEAFNLQTEEDATDEECRDESMSCKHQQSQVVDIIISEWMGYFLLRESMLDSVIRARDMFLKPKSGILLPSHATMLIAPIMNEDQHHMVIEEYLEGMNDWNDYLVNAKKQYGVDMSILTEEYDKEQRDYYLKSSHYVQLDDDTILAPPIVVKTLDLAVCTLEDAKGVDEAEFSFDIESSGSGADDEEEINGFAGWFTVDFQSRTDEVGKQFGAKMTNPVHFSSSPEIGDTHWGHQVFYFTPAIPIQSNDKVTLDGTMEMIRSKQSARLYNVKFQYTIEAAADGSNNLMDMVESVYKIP